ncbi:MAG TPA: pyridine nucleotide-disulfide oxidoreductase [Nitrospiraceae bacterium]|nr:pyridine nucleotide-disulfide oxidoreductase [Nitrospiraceae bacterium]
MAKYVIVGGVAAGMSAAARLRRLDEFSQILVLERGGHISYANCGLPYYIGGAIKDRNKLTLQTPESFKSLFNIEVRIKNEVIAVSPQHRILRVRNLETGSEYDESYDKLLLCPGGSPVIPPIPGIQHSSIRTLWTIPDTDKIHDMVNKGAVKSALIVGGGFIGLEMAENLSACGIKVTVVEKANHLLSVIDYEMAAVVHRELKVNKIEFRLEDEVSAFDGQNNSVIARLKSGSSVTADLVLLSIGVKPNTEFLKDSGLEIGPRKHIIVDEYLKTSDANIYAAGDAIEVVNPFTKKKTAIPLAGPANKQGRIAADNLYGLKARRYKGALGTAIVKVFDLTVGVTGATEKFCKTEGISYDSVIVHHNDYAGYYPGSTLICLKLVFSPVNRRILGAQATGYNGVDKRIDVIATAIKAGMTVDDLAEIEHAYAPPYAAAKDVVNMAGFAAQNILDGLVRPTTWDKVLEMDKSTLFLLDVRTPSEYEMGTIEGAVNIPIEELRDRISSVPRDKKIVVFCHFGVRGYMAGRILEANGITNYVNLSGGSEIYHRAVAKREWYGEREKIHLTEINDNMKNKSNERFSTIIEVDACGMQCPGPIMRLKEELDKISPGETISIIASDPGFYNDASSWADATGNTVHEISVEKGIVKAVIEKGTGRSSPALSAGNDKTLVVFSDTLDRAIASFVIANGALAMGRKVSMFFTFWGLNILRKDSRINGIKRNLLELMFGKLMPRGSKNLSLSKMNMAGMGARMIRGIMKTKNVPSLEDMIKMAMNSGATIIACQMSMDLMGIRREELIDGIQIGGVASFLAASEKADTALFI